MIDSSGIQRNTGLRAFVDSASPGRNDAESLTCASEYLPGRFSPMMATTASSQAPATTHLAVRPEATESREDSGDS